VLFGLVCNAFRSLSSVSVRAFAAVSLSGTDRRVRAEPVVLVLWVWVLLDMTTSNRHRDRWWVVMPRPERCGPRCAAGVCGLHQP
jgi:hypothetical protein